MRYSAATLCTLTVQLFLSQYACTMWPQSTFQDTMRYSAATLWTHTVTGTTAHKVAEEYPHSTLKGTLKLLCAHSDTTVAGASVHKVA